MTTKKRQFSRTALINDIMKNARSANIPPGSAEVFANKTADHVEAWIKNRSTVTQDDLDRIIAKKLSTYNRDLAFFYKNNGKII